MSYSNLQVWMIIVLLGIGTFVIRFSFLGLVGDRKLPEWVLRHLRYTPVAVLPGLVAPLILWPDATGGELDPARLAAAFMTILIAYYFKAVVWAMIGGATTLYGVQFLLSL
ncbi:MAG: AzlD domain-containing protein [Litoreibacter sp.]